MSSEDALVRIFRSAKIGLSFFVFGLEVTGASSVTDIEPALTKMLESLRIISKNDTNTRSC